MQPLRPISMSRSNTAIVNCHCAVPSVTRNVKKEGTNFGRSFFACAKAQQDSTKCDFFQWCDETISSSIQSFTPAPMPSRLNVNENSQIICICGISAALRNVKKEGSNFGKQFFACSKPQSDLTKCDFFQWNDNSSGSSCISRFEQNAQTIVTNKTKCHCNLIAVTRTLSKAGANQGRQFYTCTKSAARCNFFQWLDEEGGSSSIKRPQGSTSSGVVTCFKCGQEGHFATNCNGKSDSRRSSGKSFKGKKRKSQYEDD